jgi:gamma-glutamylaminecyclotransferase
MGDVHASSGQDVAALKSAHSLVFVFGTLKEGFPNFGTNRGARLPGAFVTLQRYPLYLVGERCSPWLIDAPGEGKRIHGQVFEVNHCALNALDQLERITEADGYRRRLVDVESAQGVWSVFAYLKPVQSIAAAEVRVGPLSEYTLEHAALYRPRTSASPQIAPTANGTSQGR